MLWQPTRGILQPNQSWRRGQGAAVTFAQGIYFRNTDNQTDPTNYDAETFTGSTNYPRVSAQGNNVGWTVIGTGLSAADRDVTTDVRLKGIVFSAQATTSTYRIDLPAPGTYNVRFASGDSGYSHNCRMRVYDNASLLLDYDAGAVLSNNWASQDSTIATSEANWVGKSAVPLVFASTICLFAIGGSTGSDPDSNWVLNTVFVSS